jgi:hypothetical protein
MLTARGMRIVHILRYAMNRPSSNRFLVFMSGGSRVSHMSQLIGESQGGVYIEDVFFPAGRARYYHLAAG